MIQEIHYGPTYLSEFSLPDHESVTYSSIACSADASIQQQELHLIVTASFNLTDIIRLAPHEVLKAETRYKISTDGNLDKEELYDVFEHAMICLIRSLHRPELNKRKCFINDLHPTPSVELEKDLKEITEFYNAMY